MSQSADLVARRLQDQPIEADIGATELHHLEVVVAWNLDMPYRHAQEYFWLEVFASDAKQAVDMAATWALEAGEAFESTDLVRQAHPHILEFGKDEKNLSLKVAWGLPLPSETPTYAPVRHPGSGIRIGFRASQAARERFLPDADRYQLELVTAKPTDTSRPECVVPLVFRP